MWEFLDRLTNILRVDWLVDQMRDNEEFLMTKGLRALAVVCFLIAVVFGFLVYVQFSEF